ncbi:hypothetical protein B0H14DRAFT_3084139 [Mycena olivaceomarginata]|nr:hypothetical protein B0H14DRAFT_3084139 [Mycena olivaceomarginata]
MSSTAQICQFCLRPFDHASALRIHQSKSPACKKKQDAHLETLMAQAMIVNSIPEEDVPDSADEETGAELQLEYWGEYLHKTGDTATSIEPPAEEDPPAMRPAVTIKDVEDKDCLYSIRDDQVLAGGEILGPFESNDEWELAKWLIKNGHNQMEVFMKLPIIQNTNTAYSNKDQILQAIDDLLGSVGWKLERLTLQGDLQDDNGDDVVETLELWYRDPVECIWELMGNLVFRNVMQYAPQKVFEDAEGKSKVINEMWTAAWWWKLQKLLPLGVTIAPIILSSDKTKLSNFRSDRSAWLVYLTIGNISKDVRQEASSHATILVGYIPVGKFGGYSDKTHPAAKYRTFHHCMSIIVCSLISAGKVGVDMTCSDGYVHWVWPILAAYVADYPEQCLIANCMENRCPEQAETLELLKEHQSGFNNPAIAAKSKADFDELGLRPVYAPFWADLPHSDIFQAFTPDLLHRLRKGVFKDHLVKWCTKIVGEKEVDARFRLCHCTRTVLQWTGKEHKAMEKLFISVVAGAAPERAVGTARAVLDFIYFSSLQSHTTASLRGLTQSLDDFHRYKDIFTELKARLPEHFNIPKIHSLEHYVDLIFLFGSVDGFNTESLERLHIGYAKNAYRASNKRDYIIQMTQWLHRQEAVDRFTLYLKWMRNGTYKSWVNALQPLVEDLDSVFVTPTSMDHTRASPAASQMTYKIAKSHPTSLANISVANIVVEAVKAYISSYLPLEPQPFVRFNLYKHLTFALPAIPKASLNNRQNVVRATPPVPARGVHSPPHPAHLDFALVRTGEKNECTEGTALEGLWVAHIKVLFQLPQIYGLHMAHPLAYIEWYTPFGVETLTMGLAVK